MVDTAPHVESFPRTAPKPTPASRFRRAVDHVKVCGAAFTIFFTLTASFYALSLGFAQLLQAALGLGQP
jgi:hypothetical protein